MIEKILERLEEEREIAYADFDKYANDYELNLDDTYDDFFHKGLARAKTIVLEVAKEYGNGWIPCSEQMPQENKLILIYAESTARGGSIRCVAELRNGFWFAQIASDTLGLTGIGQFKVIAWQPLPQPYQKGE